MTREKKYKSSREVDLALRDLDHVAAKVNKVLAEHAVTDTAQETSEFEPSPIKKPWFDA